MPPGAPTSGATLWVTWSHDSTVLADNPRFAMGRANPGSHLYARSMFQQRTTRIATSFDKGA